MTERRRKKIRKFKNDDTWRGKEIKAMRARREPTGLTQEELSIELSKLIYPEEVSQQRISAIERGVSMSASEMLAICEFFGIDANQFKKKKSDRNPES